MQLPVHLNRNLRARFHAWWEGYEFTPPDEPSAEESADAEEKPVARSTSSKDPWSKERIEVAQMLWGKEFISPVGAGTLAELATPLMLTKDHTLLHLGCGLGGGTRALIQAHGVKATGMDTSATLARAGMDLSTAAGLKAEAPINAVDLATFEVKPAAYDRALIEHVLHTQSDKEGVLKRVLAGLKPDAKVLVLDFVVQSKAPGRAVAAWSRVEPAPVKPWNLDSARKALAKLGVEVGEVADETVRISAALVHGLDAFLKNAQGQAPKRTVTAALKREVDLWLARKAALDAGEIKALAIRGVKAG